MPESVVRCLSAARIAGAGIGVERVGAVGIREKAWEITSGMLELDEARLRRRGRKVPWDL